MDLLSTALGHSATILVIVAVLVNGGGAKDGGGTLVDVLLAGLVKDRIAPKPAARPETVAG